MVLMVLMKQRGPPQPQTSHPCWSQGLGHPRGDVGAQSQKKGAGCRHTVVKSSTGEGKTPAPRGSCGPVLLPETGGGKPGRSGGCLGTRGWGVLLRDLLGCCYQGMWGGRGGTEKASTGSSCRGGFAQLASSLALSLTSRSLPGQADASALLSCAWGSDVESTSNPSPPRCWAVSRPLPLSSVQGKPLPAPGPSFSL